MHVAHPCQYGRGRSAEDDRRSCLLFLLPPPLVALVCICADSEDGGAVAAEAEAEDEAASSRWDCSYDPHDNVPSRCTSSLNSRPLEASAFAWSVRCGWEYWTENACRVRFKVKVALVFRYVCHVCPNTTCAFSFSLLFVSEK